MCEFDSKIQSAVDAFEVVSNAAKAQKAFDFIRQYKAATGHRPSLSSIVMLWQEAQAKVDAAEAAGGPLDA